MKASKSAEAQFAFIFSQPDEENGGEADSNHNKKNKGAGDTQSPPVKATAW